MCGIVGIYHLDNKPISRQSISKFTRSLAHRGPDGNGVYIADARYVALGHTRLSIFDLSSQGNQPFTIDNKRYWITFNGEIYNFLEIRTELERSGCVFESDTDTEVVLASYIKWGRDCLKHFNGMWAFSIWDDKLKKMFLARDRFGVKPLYYIHLPNKIFAFSSESKSFESLDSFKLSIDNQHLSLAIKNSFHLESIGETIYQSVKSLHGGCYLEIGRDKKPSINRWFNAHNHISSPEYNYEYQIEEYRELFIDACRIRLRSDVEVASAVSGGLDSSSVFAVCNYLKNNANCDQRRFGGLGAPFVLAFPGTKWDELDHARRAVSGTTEKLVVVEFNEHSISDDILKQTQSSGFVYLSAPVVPLIYKTMKSMGYKVSMDGHGADEALFGYPDMISSAISKLGASTSADVVQLIDVLKNMCPGYRGQLANDKKMLLSLIAKFKKALIRTTPNRLIAAYRNYRYAQRFKTNNPPWLYACIEPHDFSLNFFEDDDPKAISYQEVHSYRLPTLLRNWDHASMAHGVEIRMPFMDYRLMTYSLGLPLSSLCSAGYSKRILRDAMVNLLSSSVRNRKDKIGVNAPMDYWFSHQLASLLLDIVSSERFLQSSVWNGRAINRYVKNKIKEKSWTFSECQEVWPYINAYIVSE